jgi:hypothetical protein
MVGFYRWGRKTVRASARMPTHAVRLHEWGTRGMGWVLCMGHPPLVVHWVSRSVATYEWGFCLETTVKLLGKFYGLVSGESTYRAFFVFMGIGLVLGCVLFFAARTCYSVSQENQVAIPSPPGSTTIVGGDGSANTGQNSGSVNVHNNEPKKP